MAEERGVRRLRFAEQLRIGAIRTDVYKKNGHPLIQ
jgi:hypothetical protein